MIFPSDPVEMRLVASLRRPGGNVTGTTSTPSLEMFGKQRQLLKETIPHATRMAILSNPKDPVSAQQVKEVRAAAGSLGIRVQHLEARGPEDFDNAFAAMRRARAEAPLVTRGTTFLVPLAKIAELAVKGLRPTMYS